MGYSIAKSIKQYRNTFAITGFVILACFLTNFSLLSSLFFEYHPDGLSLILPLPTTLEIAVALNFFFFLLNLYIFKHYSLVRFLTLSCSLIVLIIYSLLLWTNLQTSYFEVTYLYFLYIVIPLSISIFLLLKMAQILHSERKDNQPGRSIVIFLLFTFLAFYLWLHRPYPDFDLQQFLETVFVLVTCCISCLLTIAHVSLRRSMKYSKTFLFFLSRLLFCGMVAVFLIGIWIPLLQALVSDWMYYHSSSHSNDFYFTLLIVGRELSGTLCLCFIQLRFVLPYKRTKLKAMAVGCGALFFVSLLVFLILANVDLLLSYNGTFFTDRYSFATFLDFCARYIGGFINISLIMSFLCLCLLIIHLLVHRYLAFLKKLTLFLSVLLCLVSICIAFYINGLRPFDFYSGGRAGGIVEDMNVNDIQSVFPGFSRSMLKNQSYRLTLKLTSKDGYIPLNKLQANVNGTTGSLQNLLGAHNTACIKVELENDPDQFNISTISDSEYPLDQQSISWNWIITPKRTGSLILLPVAVVAGEQHCKTMDQALRGPFPLAGIPALSISVEDPQENILTQLFQHIDIGTAITTALGTLLVSFIGWVSVGIWKRMRSAMQRGNSEKKKVPLKKQGKKHK